MDFLDPHKKRAHLIRLYIGYALMAIAVGIGTIVVLYSSFGYGVDRHTGKVIQNGLVFLSSSPEGAAINLVSKDGDKQPETNTNTKLTIPANEYSVTLTKQGYRNWHRDFVLDGGSVERLMYPLLIPEKLDTVDSQLYSGQPSLITGSPDRHWVLVLKPGSQTEFEVFDANEKNPTAALTAIPPDLLSPGANQTLKVVEWSTNNKHLILQHSFDSSKEFILFNFENPSESININRHFNMTPSEVALYDKLPDELFILNGGALHRGVVKDKKLTPLLTSVVTFKPHGNDMVEYISNKDTAATNKVTLRLFSNDVDYIVRDFPAGTTYLLDIARFDGHWYVVAGAQNEHKVYVYEDPLDALKSNKPSQSLPARTLRVDTPQKVLFSANARFISTQGINQNFTVYDAETDRQYRYVIDRPLDLNNPASWMDGHRLVTVNDGQAIIFDFDGTNLQVLNRAGQGTVPQFDREYKAIYNVAPSEQAQGRFALTRASLRVED